MNIIHRYLMKELLQIFFFFLMAFFLLYILLDSSIHIKVWNQKGLSWTDIALYYWWQFSQHLSILLPLALMISSIKILTSMNTRGELSALFSAGVAFKQLYNPFIKIALCTTALLYINAQFLQPLSFNFIKRFEQRHFKNVKENLSPINVLNLADNSLLIYQNYESYQKVFSNVFLVKNFNEIYRIKRLTLQKESAFGEGIDILVRNASSELIKKESRESCFFSKIAIDEKKLCEQGILPRMQSLSSLFSKFSWNHLIIGKKMSDKEAEMVTYLSYKLFVPWLSFLAIMAPPCLCLRCERMLSIFFFYALSLFAFFSLFALLNACLILSAHQIISPFWSVPAIIIPLFGYVGLRYAKL